MRLASSFRLGILQKDWVIQHNRDWAEKGVADR